MVFDKLRKVKDAMAAGYRGEGPSPEALAALTPEQRAAYDAQMALVAQAQDQVRAQHVELVAAHAQRFAERPLQGPAGEHLFGPAAYPGGDPSELLGMSPKDAIALQTEQARQELAGTIRNPFGGEGRSAAPDAGEPPDGSTDPAAHAARERAERDAARAPYLAPNRVPVTIARLSAVARSELGEVGAYLASSGLASRPDLVFGVYRVPDHIGTGNLMGDRNRYVEWDIVHATVEGLPPGPEPEVATFDGKDRWVERRIGEPSVLDEDLAIAYLAASGIGPDRTFGIARRFRVRNVGGGDDSSSTTVADADGVHVLHAPTGEGRRTLERFGRSRPVAIPAAGIDGVHVEVLHWAAIASAVRPQTHRLPPVPSPFPYLPSTPQELLRAYLEVVGVHPAHSFAAAVVEDEPRSIDGIGGSGLFSTSTNVGAKQPSADGKERRRLTAGSRVVLAYVDTPTYVEGRQRWDEYQRAALQASLANQTGARRPVEAPDHHDLPGGLRGLVRLVDRVDSIVDPAAGDPWAGTVRHRYCWPPTDAR